MKILFVVPYPLKRSPSQRFRFEQYFGLLTEAGIQYRVQSFFNEDTWNILYSKGNNWKKFSALVKGFFKRLGLLFILHKYDFVFIHREAAPVGPPVFEWLYSRKKIVYDFDDAIWATDKTKEGGLARFLRWRKKVGYICRIATTVSAGNDYLANYARQFNTNVIVNPTTIDTSYHDILANAPLHRGIVIGWTGSHSTLRYLDDLIPVLNDLETKFPNLRIRVIANQDPKLPLKSYEFTKWSPYTEIQDLMGIDIGIMPLPDDEWSKGKCGFKALQYMSLQIPSVISAVGVNTKIINDGVNGFLCADKADWEKKLTMLITDPELRTKIGKAGRQSVTRSYSVISNASTFFSLFEPSASNTSASK